MRKNFGPQSWVYPEPVFIVAAYDENGKPNAMNAAWGGLSGANQLSFCLSPGHKTVIDLLKTGAFTVSMGTADQVVPCDYVGLASGNDTPDKMERAGFHTTKAEHVNAPLIDELPVAVECKVVSYDPTSCRLVGEIVNISADESALTDGAIDPKKFNPIIYDGAGHDYYVLGEKVGNAFEDGLALK